MTTSLNLLFAQETKMLGTGVLLPKNDFKEINSLNSDGSNYLKLVQSLEGEINVSYKKPIPENVILKCVKTYYPYYYLEFTKYRISLPKIAIRAFYTDENVVVFDALKIDKGYKIFINGDWKIVKFNKSVVYEDWPTFIKHIYVTVDKQHPLRKESNEKSMVVSDNDKYSYKVLEVKQDWINVVCSKECEGCPENKILKGWIKWRDKDMILLKLYYAC